VIDSRLEDIVRGPEEIEVPYVVAGDLGGFYKIFTDRCKSSFYYICSGLRQS